MTEHDQDHKRGIRAAALLSAGGVLAGSAVVGLLPSVAQASSHREAPLIAAEPALDNTDVYAFTSPEDANTVTLIANWAPFSEPNGGPNFYPWATGVAHDINIDNDGDAVADVVYRWEFSTQDARGTGTFLYNNGPVTSLGDANLLFRQTYDLTVSVGGAPFAPVLDDAPVAPSFTGPKGMPDYAALRTEAIKPLPGGGKSLAAQADDPFFLDLRVFDLLYGADLSETGQDTLAGYNVNTLALQVPKNALAIAGDAANNPVVGIWSTTSRPSMTTRNADGSVTSSGSLQQVSRLGAPLVNEVVVPTGLKDAFNAISPDQDAAAAGGAVVDRVLNPEVPALIEAIYGIKAPATPRYDIFEVFLTGVVTNAEFDVDGNPSTPNPIEADLNSQVLNAAAVPADFQPSEMLRLNMSVPVTASPNRLGVVGGDLQGFPNGRRLGDDVLDISLLALEGVYDVNNIPADRAAAGVAALAGGDGVNQNGPGFGNSFPYIGLPNTTAVNGGSPVGDGNPQPVPPAAGPASTGTAGVNGYPVGGVETGEGGLDEALIPALSGSAALVLIGAGAGSLIRGRLQRRTVTSTPEV
ncbi:DUF4331 domain-containing protein [Geodermatophilus sp. DSM 44513]|uniref:DUF4331 domain-containing protein n=1 Tax=Geodermatophilus sp. DSM 44513 TaxID=1528104 RepID=UPI0012793519|nr:DUF4331 domain-containing protein [Geodermatophilus sp. DSM 44513]WNV76868.1 DUF4331 domain-containing protein [Geodermatophilus sp. DSM 44513]